ncbi:MAG: phage tail tape measure protein [Balneola sp.]
MARNSVRLQLILEGKDAKRTLEALQREFGDLERAGVKSHKKITKSSESLRKKTDKLTNTTKQNTNTTKVNQKAKKDLSNRLNRLERIYKDIIESKSVLNRTDIKRARSIKNEIDATKKQIQTNKILVGDFEKVSNSKKSLVKETQRLSDTNTRASNTLRNGLIAGYAALGIAVQRGVSRAIEKGKEFEQQLASLEAITGITGEQLDRLGNTSLELSAKYGVAASNIIEANKLVASQLAQKIDFGTEEGFQQLQKVSEQAVVLSQAAGIQLSDAVATTTSIINQFNLSAEESVRVINTLAAGAKFGAAEVPEIGRALVNSGAAAAAAEQEIETVNAAIQVLAANGQIGERAGTALRAIFIKLQTESKKLAELGLGEVDIKANGLVNTLKQLQPVVEDTTALNQIFGAEAINQVQILIRNAESVADLTEKVTGSNVAYEQAAVRLDTFEGASNQLTETINSKLIVAFTESDGVLVKLIKTLTVWVEQTAFAVGVINDFFDAYSEMRGEIDQNNTVLRIQTQRLVENKNALLEQISTAEKGSEQEALLYENLENVERALVRRRRELEKNKKELEDGILAQTKNVALIKEQETGLFKNTARIEESEQVLASLKIQYRGAESALNTFNSAVGVNTESIKDNAVEGEKTVQNLDVVKKGYDEIKESIQKVNELEIPDFDFGFDTTGMQSLDFEMPEISGDFKPFELDDIIILENSIQGLTNRIKELKVAQSLVTNAEDYKLLQGEIDKTSEAIEQISGSVMVVQGSYEALTNKVNEYKEAQRKATSPEEFARLQKKIDGVNSEIQELTGVSSGLSNEMILLNGIANDFTSSFGQGISNVIVQGEKLNDVLSNIGKLLLSSAIQKGLSILLTGGLSGTGLFGSGGGLFGSIGKVLGFSDGGEVRGAGTGTSDSIPARLSNGEFVVKAKEAKKNKEVLRAINEGRFEKSTTLKELKERYSFNNSEKTLEGADNAIDRSSEKTSSDKLVERFSFKEIIKNAIKQTELREAVKSTINNLTSSNETVPSTSIVSNTVSPQQFSSPSVSNFANNVAQNSVNNIQNVMDSKGMGKEIANAVSEAMSGAVLKVGKTGDLIVEFRRESRRLKELGSDDFIPFKSLS